MINNKSEQPQPEIKAGQVWVNVNNEYDTIIIYEDSLSVLTESRGIRICYDTHFFKELFKPKPSPKTRPITWEDVRKLLSEHGVIYFKIPLVERWLMDTNPYSWKTSDKIGEYQFSPNPFSDNPIIIGPLVDVAEGEGE